MMSRKRVQSRVCYIIQEYMKKVGERQMQYQV